MIIVGPVSMNILALLFLLVFPGCLLSDNKMTEAAPNSNSHKAKINGNRKVLHLSETSIKGLVTSHWF